MNPRRSFIRKIAYVVAIAVLLAALNWISRPAVRGRDGASGDPGGKLAQLRREYQLDQTYLGEISTTNETIKLASLGMQGIAANLLWSKANDAKMRKDWTTLSATLEQLAKLQPHFVKVWEFQAWNLSYNVSAEFDDYRERYRWVMRGIDFLHEGLAYNEREAIMPWHMGWFIRHKIGRSDERKQFRKMFVADDDFHGSRPMAERDNFLVSRVWFLQAEDMAVNRGARMSKTPSLYRADPSMSLMAYAEVVEQDGVFGEVAKRAWSNASASWRQFGTVELPTTYNRMIRLGEMEALQERSDKMTAELDGLAPGARQKIRDERVKGLEPKLRRAWDKPENERNADEVQAYYEARDRVKVNHGEVARRAPAAERARAEKLAKDLDDLEVQIKATDAERGPLNYTYWRTRSEAEQNDITISARSLCHRGDVAFRDGDILTARKLYEQGMPLWRQVFDKYPSLLEDRQATDDAADVVRHYKRILDQADEPLPKDFILKDIVELIKQREGG